MSLSPLPFARRVAMGARFALRMRAGRTGVMKHLASPRTRDVPMPTFVQLRVTNLCNLRCKMCGQWGDTGIFREGSSPEASDGEAERLRIRELIGLKRQMGLSDYVRLLDEIAPFDPIVSLFGGEPFLFPDILPLMREVKKRGLALTVITNGWHLERHAKDLVEIGIESIAVSVDGAPSVHDRIRGRKGSFEQVERGIRAVAAARRGRGLPTLVGIFPVTELNVDTVEEALSSLKSLPLDVVNLGLRWFVAPEVGREYEEVMQERFQVSGASWRGFSFEWPGGKEARGGEPLLRLVKTLKAERRGRVLEWLKGRPWVSFLPSVKPHDVPTYLTDSKETFGHDLCPVAWYFAQVEPDGEVCFCGDFPDYSIGNVKEASFTDCWRSKKAEAFRETLAKGPLPICARCCGNYIYGRWERPKA